ncbi:GntR family transcriptional regulator [Blastococcus sp. CT_GayMR20]|uniref:GntR family transcriptional regulator n=1 Tax=Blastococcus sp. CT_GayMR20 TaxID=2559609 RepID=UPI0010748737|nr:GntR family transcriptional regulator [Blastococcus sp. CT_GayMR20]TFV70585.1 GntR family transcriptional regulator [Blastococcus sp. CT_GayMR20]
MNGEIGPTGPLNGHDARLDPPSLVQMAASEIRNMILSGQLGPGERLLEERLTEYLGISRPPLREALRLLEHERLIVTQPRRGSTVATLTDQDVYEILTLRKALERMAVELGVPVRYPERLEACWDALAEMEKSAAAQDRASLVQNGYRFHAAIVALARHSRLEEIYASVHQQLLLCMARNLHARERHYEDLAHHVNRHRHLLELIASGDQEAVLSELAVHGEQSFVGGETSPSA